MKKNKVMRLSSGLLVLTILTTCIISGTFAKYVTGDKEQDFARAAKWGVTTTISGALFGQHYGAFAADSEGTEVAGSNQISAVYTGSVDRYAEGESGPEENIVAPGTKSENMTVSISGKPEVAGKIAVTVDSTKGKNYSDIWLASGKYGVMTDVTKTVKTSDDIVGLYVKEDNSENYVAAKSFTEGTTYYKLSYDFELSKETYVTNENMPRFVATNADDASDQTGKYYPILWGLANKKSGNDFGDVDYSIQSVQDIKAMIEKQFIGEGGEEEYSFDSHTDLGAQIGDTTINWEWPFEAMDSEETEISSVVDGCDTILSKLMAWETDSNYQVVKISGTEAAPTYTGVTKTDPTAENANGVTHAVAGTEQVACLTVGFNLEVTVSQVD